MWQRLENAGSSWNCLISIPACPVCCYTWPASGSARVTVGCGWISPNETFRDRGTERHALGSPFLSKCVEASDSSSCHRGPALSMNLNSDCQIRQAEETACVFLFGRSPSEQSSKGLPIVLLCNYSLKRRQEFTIARRKVPSNNPERDLHKALIHHTLHQVTQI